MKINNKAVALVDQGIVSGTNFISGILITRFVGIETYGQFMLFWMIFLLLQAVSNAFIGLPGQVLSQGEINPTGYLNNNNRLGNLILSLLILILYIGFSIFSLTSNISNSWGYWLFPVLIVLCLKHEINRKYFYTLNQNHKALYIDLIQYLLQLPALIILAYFGLLNFNSLVLLFIIFSLLAQLTTIALKDKKTGVFNWNDLPFKANWKYGKYLIFTALLQWFSGNIILITASGMLGLTVLGIIRLLQNIMGVFNVLFLTLENVVPVKAAALFKQGGKKQLKTYFKKIIIIVGSVYALLLITLNHFGTDLLTLIYGAQYAQYAYLLDLFLLLYILVFIGTIAQLFIKSIQQNQGIFYAYLASSLIALIIAKPLLINFQIQGVIFGFGIMQMVTVTFYLFSIKNKI